MTSELSQLYYHGEIYTVDQSCPMPEAVAVKRGKVVAVGSEAECRGVLGKGFERVDLDGRAMLPGFIDTHLHPIMMVFYEMNVDLGPATGIYNLQEKLHRAAEKGSPDDWLVGVNFDEQNLKEQRLPTRHDLDAACANRPVVVIKHDAHMVIANTKAIKVIGVQAASQDPQAGVIDREPGGYPSGVFREAATQLVFDAMPIPDIQLLTNSARSTFRKLLASGVTSAGIVLQTGTEGPAGAAGAFDVLAMQLFLEHVPLNLYGILITDDVEKMKEARRSGLHQEEPGGNRIGAVKIFSDGSFGSCTAFMNEPYSDQPDKQGFLVHDSEDIYRRMVIAHKAGLQVAVHAIGDAANRLCVRLYSQLLNEYPRTNHRHRIEHASLLDEFTIRDMACLGLVVSTQPLFIHSEKHWLHKRLGVERAKSAYPLRALLDAGVKVAGASDAPVESTDVLHAIQCCVTREGFEPQQAITAEEAVRMFTLDAAYAQFEESVKGSISVGKRADMVVLSANPISVPPEKIRNIRVVKTIVGGQAVYQAQ